MTSEKQIAANRQNAQKSTGPQSPEAKKKVSQNALRHGLTGQVTLMPDEDREAHDNFCAAIIASLAPEGALEIQFAQSIAEDNWRINRGRAVETNLFALGVFRPNAPGMGPAIDTGHHQIDAAINAAQVFAADPKKFQLLSLYLQRTNRAMETTLNRLNALQTERKARRQQDLEEAAALVHLNEIKRLPVTETERTGQNGFVFSAPQIHAFLHRRSQLREVHARETGHKNHPNNPPSHHQNGNKRLLRRAA